MEEEEECAANKEKKMGVCNLRFCMQNVQIVKKTFRLKGKGKVLYSTVSSELLKALYILLSWQTYSKRHHLNFCGKHPAMLQLMHEGCSYKYSPLSVARYSYN